LNIHGTEIGKLVGVCEVAVQTQPDIVVWAFTRDCQCKAWRLHNYVDPVVFSKSYVCRNGIVHDPYCTDDSGDLVMADAPLIPHISESLCFSDEAGLEQPEISDLTGFDGNASGFVKKMPRALAVENDAWVDYVDVRACSKAWYDANGNVLGWYPIR